LRHAGTINQPLGLDQQRTAQYRFENLALNESDSDEVFVILSLSGGGTRSAAFAYGVVRELQEIKLPDGRSLLDEVDIISAVSGSSFVPATLRNYPSEVCGYERPRWAVKALTQDSKIHSRLHVRARNLATYEDQELRPWIHLLDGGLSDNIGIRAPGVSLLTEDVPASILTGIRQGTSKRVWRRARQEPSDTRRLFLATRRCGRPVAQLLVRDGPCLARILLGAGARA
jgi:hypothetical protein